MDILRDLRAGEFDVLIGINLLREGLDLPEVSLVAILDADKEGFLRSPRSLIQTIGRAARNASGMVIMYADRVTDAMAQAIGETQRRRAIQTEYNRAHGITPETIRRAILDINPASGTTDYYAVPRGPNTREGSRARPARAALDPAEELAERVEALRQQMFAAAENLEFETAARLRDELRRLQSGLEPEDAARDTSPPRAPPRSGSPPRRKSRPSLPAQRRRR
jgi:excinuclease ABC subunit B